MPSRSRIKYNLESAPGYVVNERESEDYFVSVYSVRTRSVCKMHKEETAMTMSTQDKQATPFCAAGV